MSVSDFEPEETAVEVWPFQVLRTEIVDPTQLLAHELNPNIHPMPQQSAMKAALDRVGWLRNVLVNQRTGKVLDGHMRVGIAISSGALVPVDYVDLSEEDELLALATIDPLGEMRAKDREIMADLAASIPDINDALAAAINASAKTFDRVSEPPLPDPTDPGPAGDIEQQATDTFLFGYVRWKTNKVNCTGAETETLTRLYLEFLAEHDGKDDGFLGWLTQPRADTRP